MNNSTGEYNQLLLKLDVFIRKYYKNQMIRGALYCLAIIFFTYLVVALAEYFGRFSIAMRTFLFWSFVGGVLFVIAKFFLLPLSKIFRLGKIISHEQAAQIIGKHFPHVQDKLLNTLQLKSMAVAGDNSLLEASIAQKIGELRPVPFSSAIDFRENRRYLKWVLPPVSIVLILLFAAPSILTKPTERLIKHGQIIAEEAPFTIKVTNDNLTTPENKDYTVNIELSGNEIPEKVYVMLGSQQFQLEKQSTISFSHTFKNVREDLTFAFSANGFFSDQYELKVIPSPRLLDFGITLNFPSYLNRAQENVQNTGDIVVPEGTQVQWNFNTANNEALLLQFGDSTYTIPTGNDRATFRQTAVQSAGYSIQTSNRYIPFGDSLNYRIQVVPDLHPSISMQEEKDSASFKWVYFTGEVKDDYGFRRLTFNYRLTQRDGAATDDQLHTIDLPVTQDATGDIFFHSWDLG